LRTSADARVAELLNVVNPDTVDIGGVKAATH
jgi:hypothetical protein